ncbi:MAG: ATP-binding cassette domain-containing protein, partial [Clostridiales bacterium]|nr:ATP-binding cassette domain-containing protein [Clostridiales bacterium]
MDNFRLAKPDVTEMEAWDALKKVNLSDFIKENGGLEKIITEDGNNISGGQKQRLALAVSLVADKDICIFDEATSNIDVDSEAIIMENIARMASEKNIIVISHRLANVVGADQIYYMEDGQIKESGTHDKLMKKNGGYAALFLEQKRLENSYKNAGEVVA